MLCPSAGLFMSIAIDINNGICYIQLDTYVKVQVLSTNGKDVAKSKTTIRRGMYDPEYNESFVFQVAEPDLREIAILLSVISISKKRRKKEVMGWFALGQNATSERGKRHWNDVIKYKETAVSQWHILSGTV